ncbi:MAG: ABC transporter permease [Parcubacteria group bacterium 21-54-25]|nr:MAG: ABC transporter permease [Parcubacteria group bacterium 21-54-25]HQU07556.1 ABC transporter permease [Candidatus Paceibacterota bacterium]
MTLYEEWVSFYTIVRKDAQRILKIWPQTFMPSAVTSALYFLIFGAFLGSRIGEVNGVSYIMFVVPGIVMLAVVTNAFSNTATVIFTSKFFSRSIDEILVSPTPPWVMVAGFVTTGIVRGVGVGLVVLVVSLLFTHLVISNALIILLFLVLTSALFSLGGFINGVYADSFDGISIVPTFVLTPLVYLGGVFYSANSLPSFWGAVTKFNPIFYIINGFRYGFIGTADVPLLVSLGVLLALVLAFAVTAWYLTKKGLGLRQ